MARENGTDATYLRRLLAAAAVAIGLLIIWQTVYVLLLVFGAVLLALLLTGLASMLNQRTGMSERWALACTILAITALVVVSGYLFGTVVSAQVAELVNKLPQALQSLQDRFGDAIPGWLRDSAGQLGDGGGGSVISKVGSAVFSVVSGVADLLIIVVGGVYIAVQPGLYRKGIILLFPKSRQEQAQESLRITGSALRRWLAGQLISMVLVGVLTTIGLLLLGVPSALALGLLAGLAEFVPLVGPFAAAIPALLIAFTQDGNTALYVLLLYLAIQQVESNLILPLVERRMVSIPPALTLFAVLAMGVLLGPLGILFATPLTVAAFVLIRKLYVHDLLDRHIGEKSNQT